MTREISSETSGWYVAWAVIKDAVGNTVSDVLMLNTIADAPHVVFDEDKSTGERIWAGAKGTDMFWPVEDSHVTAAEQRLGFPFPEQLEHLLTETGTGTLEAAKG